MSSSPFETFVNQELPLRVPSSSNPIEVTKGKIAVSTGRGLEIDFKDISELNLGANLEVISIRQEPISSSKILKLDRPIHNGMILGNVIVHLDDESVLELDGEEFVDEETLDLNETFPVGSEYTAVGVSFKYVTVKV